MRGCGAPPSPARVPARTPARPGPGHLSPAGGALSQGRWAHSPDPAARSGAGLGVGCPRGRARRSRPAHLWAPRGRPASPPSSARGEAPAPSPNGEHPPARGRPRAPSQAPRSRRTHRPIRGAHAPLSPPRRGAPAPPARQPRPRPSRPAPGPPSPWVGSEPPPTPIAQVGKLRPRGGRRPRGRAVSQLEPGLLTHYPPPSAAAPPSRLAGTQG